MATQHCRYIKANGRRCASFAVQGQALCYFHRSINKRHRALNPANMVLPESIPEPHRSVEHLLNDPLSAQYYGVHKQLHGPLELDLPPLEDRAAIQMAISLLIFALGQNRIDSKRAGMMLYGLQVASATAAKFGERKEAIVRETVVDENGMELALDEAPEEEPYIPRTAAERMLMELAEKPVPTVPRRGDPRQDNAKAREATEIAECAESPALDGRKSAHSVTSLMLPDGP